MAGPWRLLVHGPASGPWNMAVDETLLELACRGGRAVRLYRWEGAWLSLGQAQPPDPARLAACAAAGVGVVRRVTGGLAVLHGADLTYALAAPEAALPAGLLGSYALVADALCEGFARLGVPLSRSRSAPGRGRRAGFDCFAEPAAEELVVDGRKLCGSAQRRTRGGVLQHGSIRLAPDRAEAAAAAGLDPARATSLSELGGNPDPGPVVDALVRGFEAVLGASLVPADLEPEERQEALRRAARIARDRPGAS